MKIKRTTTTTITAMSSTAVAQASELKTVPLDWLTELRLNVPLDTKVGHFEDVLCSQSLTMVLK